MDIISNLPDELLLRIISLLTTKEAISTSILSKRWKSVWVNLQNVDFRIDSASVAHVDRLDTILDRLESSENSRFRLSSTQKLPPGVTAKWITYAVKLNAREMNFSVPSMELPSNLFTSSTLTHLQLNSTFSGSITVPEEFCLPNVKSLVFMVSGPPKELTEKLFRSCPKLEELEVGGMRYYNGQVYHKDQIYDISCSSLRVLDISLWGHKTNAIAPIVFLNAPKLESIEIEEKFGVEFVVQGSCAPVKATICLLSCCDDLLSEEDGNRAITLLKGISGVKFLTVDESMIYALSKFHLNNVPPLLNLTRLFLRIPRLCGWAILFNILENSPNLQSLTIQKDCDHYDDSSSSEMHPQNLPQDFDWTEPHSPAQCLQSHLEEIILTGYFWMRCDLKSMKYLLGNAKVLKEVTSSPHRIGLREEVVFWILLEAYAKTLPCRYVVPPEDDE